MKYLKRFNESLNESDNTIILSMEDVKNLKHNLDYKEKGDFMTNYDWSEDTKLHINTNYIEVSGSWNGELL